MITATAADAAQASQELEALMEKYKDLKIPTQNLVLIGAVTALLIAVIILGFIYIHKHYAMYTNGIISGILAELLFSYLIYGGITFGISKIGSTAAFFEAHPAASDVFQIVLSILCRCLGIFFGIKYLIRTNNRQHVEHKIGAVLAFGLSMYAASILVGQEISFAIEYVMVSATINNMGIGAAIYEIMQNGVTEEEALASIQGMIDTSWLQFLWDGMTHIFRGLVDTSAALIVYGTSLRKLDKNWLPAAFSMVIAFYIPTLLNSTTRAPMWLLIVLSVVITAASVYTVLWLIHNWMPAEEEDLKRKPVKKNHKDDDKNQKMPKIVMPD